MGLIFDGDIESLAGDFVYDGTKNRAVAVHTAGMIEALRKIYNAGPLADDSEEARSSSPLNLVAPSFERPLLEGWESRTSFRASINQPVTSKNSEDMQKKAKILRSG